MAIKTYLTSREIRKMIESAANLRDRLIIQFYADTGCRCSELLAIRNQDVDLNSKTIMIPHLKVGIRKRCPKCGRTAGKRQAFCSRCGTDLSRVELEGQEDRHRLINIGEETVALIKEWQEKRPDKKSENLIPLTRQSIYFIIRAAGEKAGLPKLLNPETGHDHHVHPHSLRDSLAVSWLNVAKSDANKQKALQQHLGHRRFDTTMKYAKLSPSETRDTFEEVRKAREQEDAS